MKKSTLALLSIIMVVFITVSVALRLSNRCESTPPAPKAEDIQSMMAEKFPQFSVNAVVESEIAGLYELHGKNNIIYTDGTYLLVGHILTLDGQRDLTQEKIEQLPVEAVNIDTSAALTVKDGTGAKEVVMITNPECPYCSAADQWFKSANTTRKILFLPLDFHAAAKAISEHVLCAAEPAKEYKKIMYAMIEYFAQSEKQSATEFLKSKGFQLKSCKEGQSQLASMQKAIEALGITGTPMFIVDGELIEGADPKLLELIQ